MAFFIHSANRAFSMGLEVILPSKYIALSLYRFIYIYSYMIYVPNFHNLFGALWGWMCSIRWNRAHHFPKSQPDLAQTTIKLFFNLNR